MPSTRSRNRPFHTASYEPLIAIVIGGLLAAAVVLWEAITGGLRF